MKFSLVTLCALAASAVEIDADAVRQKILADLQPTIQAQVEQELQRQQDLAEQAEIKQFEGLSVSQKLKSLFKDLETQQGLHQMWKDVSGEEMSNYLGSINVQFDVEGQAIVVSSKALNAHGKPVFDYTIDNVEGGVSAVRREHEHQATPIPETKTLAEPAPVAVKTPTAVPVAPQPAPVEQPSSSASPDWEELEKQREIAFKIVYFFIFFIIMTFGLLYAYYKADLKEQQEENRKKRAMGAFYGEPTNHTFFDFLAGQMDDENYLVNPHARGAPNSASIPKKASDLETLNNSGFDSAATTYYQQQ